jgi:hypothetical protein
MDGQVPATRERSITEGLWLLTGWSWVLFGLAICFFTIFSDGFAGLREGLSHGLGIATLGAITVARIYYRERCNPHG